MPKRITDIRFVPLAAESLGVRSMCTYVETPDIHILIDPGVSLGQRFGLLPHPREYKEIMDCRARIRDFASKTEVITISHYHFDHITPAYTDYAWNLSNFDVARQIYENKTILAKNARASINPSQRRRGWMLKKSMGNFFKTFEVADGKAFTYGKTKMKFSEPVFHGEENSPLGWVIMLTIEFEGQKVMHTSDVEGPILDETLEIILSESPSITYVSGPPLYLMGYSVKEDTIKRGSENLSKLVERIPTVILDHHLLRAEKWRESLSNLFEAAERVGHKVITAAEFLGEPNNFLEVRRRELYEFEKPSESFMKWSSLQALKQKEIMPPI
ncbi:MAG: uncharacterized protein QG670_2241 [Thermoproteota archaeon]|nr:uncharacterized protein [Thermoproteota archaeon]